MTKKSKTLVCLSGTTFVLAALFSSCGEKLPVYPDAQFDLLVSEQRQTHNFIWDYAGTGSGASASGLSCKEQVDGYPLVVTSWNKVVIKAVSTDPNFQGVSVSSSDGSKVWVREISDGKSSTGANEKHDEYELVYSSDTDRNDTQVNFDTPEFFWKQKTWTKSDYSPGLVTITVSAGSFTKSFKVAARDVIPLHAIRLKFGDPQSNYYLTECHYDPSGISIATEVGDMQYIDVTLNPQEILSKNYEEAGNLWNNNFRNGFYGNWTKKYQLKENPLIRFNDYYEIIEIDNLVPENASWRTVNEFSTYPKSTSKGDLTYGPDGHWGFDAFNEHFNLGLPVFCKDGYERDVDFSELRGRKASFNFGFCGGNYWEAIGLKFHMKTQWRGYDNVSYVENDSNILYLDIIANLT